MNSVPFYRDFVATGASAYRPRGEPAQRGLLRRVVDAIALSHQRAVDRDITRVARDLGLNPGGRLTDEIERRLFERLTGDRRFRP